MGSKSRSSKTPQQGSSKGAKSPHETIKQKIFKQALKSVRHSDSGEQAAAYAEVQALKVRSPNPRYFWNPEENKFEEVCSIHVTSSIESRFSTRD